MMNADDGDIDGCCCHCGMALGANHVHDGCYSDSCCGNGGGARLARGGKANARVGAMKKTVSLRRY